LQVPTLEQGAGRGGVKKQKVAIRKYLLTGGGCSVGGSLKGVGASVERKRRPSNKKRTAAAGEDPPGVTRSRGVGPKKEQGLSNRSTSDPSSRWEDGDGFSEKEEKRFGSPKKKGQFGASGTENGLGGWRGGTSWGRGTWVFNP